ncbi:MAG TPA: hypothetical protein ENJ18_03445 [Nannocystis exedens]|nr:hypothetical protein [Nannocystis exedens]
MFKRLVQKAQKIADRHLPEEVRESGKRIAERVLERTPLRLRNAAETFFREETGDLQSPSEAEGRREIDEDASEPKVVVFGHPEEPATRRVWELLDGQAVAHRRMNLHDQPAAARQIAGLTGVMVPPYIYISGRYWGGEGEIISLIEVGDLEAVIAGDLDSISDESRRIGKLHQEFDDSMSAANICERLRLGHIVATHDLDCWCEADPNTGEQRIIYEGGPRPIEDLEAIAEEIAGQVDEGEIEAHWLLEPEISIF